MNKDTFTLKTICDSDKCLKKKELADLKEQLGRSQDERDKLAKLYDDLNAEATSYADEICALHKALDVKDHKHQSLKAEYKMLEGSFEMGRQKHYELKQLVVEYDKALRGWATDKEKAIIWDKLKQHIGDE